MPLVLLRIVLVAAASAVAWAVTAASGTASTFPPSPVFAALGLAPVNVVCLWLVVHSIRREGMDVRTYVGYRPGRLGRDVAWGLLWNAVLYVPFALTVSAVVWAMYGSGAVGAFGTIFFDPDSVPTLSPVLSLVLGVVVLVTFAPLNAPAEELLYRGHAQRGLARHRSVAVSIALPSLAFGAQHVFFAPTAPAMVVYAAAFTVWGAGSGIVAWRQGRLLPLIVAHFVVNLLSSAPALVLGVLQVTGQVA